jgi:CTP synthase
MLQGVFSLIYDQLSLHTLSHVACTPNLDSWRDMALRVDECSKHPKLIEVDSELTMRGRVNICIVGKYTGQQDSYLSVIKSLKHSAYYLNMDVDITWVDSSDLEQGHSEESKYTTAWKSLHEADGILVPGGFGNRGIEGKIAAVHYARTEKKPYLGLCLGMQIMVIEYVRTVLGLKDANSQEFNETASNHAVVFMPEINQKVMGGTMRLGARVTKISTHIGNERSIAGEAYGIPESESVGDVRERHRHRYEINPQMVSQLESAGLYFSGRDDTGERMEIAELPRSIHPFYFGTQFHPEFKSRPSRPSPPVFAFIASASGNTFLKLCRYYFL